MDNIISKITIEKNKVLIEIDGEYHLFLYTRDLKKAKFASIIKEEVILEDLDLVMLKDHVVSRGRRRIMYLLGKQDYPRSKLVEKLVKNGYIESHIDIILDPFMDKGFIDDQKLANRRVEGFKGYKSKRDIQFNLRNKGFAQEDIKEAIKEQFSDEDEFQSALKLLHKKFTLKRLRLEPEDLKKKALGFLSRKGYPISICFSAYDQFLKETSLENDDDY